MRKRQSLKCMRDWQSRMHALDRHRPLLAFAVTSAAQRMHQQAGTQTSSTRPVQPTQEEIYSPGAVALVRLLSPSGPGQPEALASNRDERVLQATLS